MFNFHLSIFELRYNEVHCHSLKLYPFLSSKIIMVSQNLDYCSRKVTHFLKYPTVTVKIERFSYDLEMKTREQNRNNKRTEIERFDWFVERIQNVRCFWLVKRTVWPGLLEAWLVLTSVKYHGNLYILIPLNQRLALTRLRATGPWPLAFLIFSPPLWNFHVFLPTKFVSLALSLLSTWV